LETLGIKNVSIVLRPQFTRPMETKDRILKGAEELFFRFGIKGITMDDVAKHIGVSKKTIYLSYKDKNDIVHSLIYKILKENEEIFSGIHKRAKNIIDEVFLYMEQMQRFFGSINPTMFYDLQKYYPKSWKLFKDFKADFIMKMVEQSFIKGIKDGHVREDINTKILARLRVEEIELAFNPMVFPADKFKVAEVQLAMAEHFLYGICTLKGYKLISLTKELVEGG
jgi:AcrR family transcriptional regulator